MRTIRTTLCATLVAIGGALGYTAPAASQVTLNVVTAGDQNMVDYVNNFLGPRFEAQNPGVKVRDRQPLVGSIADLPASYPISVEHRLQHPARGGV